MLDQEARRWLSGLLGPGVRFDEPMAAHTSFRIGGPADALIQPASEAQLREILQWAQRTRTPYLVVGGGTNLLVRDGGIRGLVIHLGRLGTRVSWVVEEKQVHLRAGAAMATRRLCRLALQQAWSGLNFALGIPGTLGGAILMNAGTARGAMADVLEEVTIMTAGGVKVRLARESIGVHYRRLQWPAGLMDSQAGPGILLAGKLRLVPGEREALRREARMMMRLRVHRQPGWQASAGCFFKNPSVQEAAGRLIEAAGLKGLRVGDAQVSPRHANFIVNLGRASAADILELAAKVREQVQTRSGVMLTPEVRIVGEEKGNP